MPTGIEEAAVAETTVETAAEEEEIEIVAAEPTEATLGELPEVESARGEGLETDEFLEAEALDATTVYAEELAKNKLGVEDIQRVVNESSRDSIRQRTAELGEELCKTELERRGNFIRDTQPCYSINPETGKSFRADYLVETQPGSTYLEVSRLGNETIIREHTASSKERLLVDSKFQNPESFMKNLPKTLEQVERMSQVPDTKATVSIPRDVATDPRSALGIRQIQESGGKVIVQAPYESSMRIAIRINRGLL